MLKCPELPSFSRAPRRVCYNSAVATREERAAARRNAWRAEVVRAGEPKAALYAALGPQERLSAFVRLNARAWRAADLNPDQPSQRAEWPGEVFVIQRRA